MKRHSGVFQAAWQGTGNSMVVGDRGAERRLHMAVFHTWPDIKNAEYEIIFRLVDAARQADIDLSVIDNHGYVLHSTLFPDGEEHRIENGDCDFAVSLHFESPKTVDVYTYAALWNPLEFYFAWDYESSIRKFLSHNDLLSCGSDSAEAHALNLLQGFGRVPPLPLPRLYHSIPRTEFRPSLDDQSRIFYAGINWERIKNEKGRHHDVLLGLDRAGLIDIYGPEVFQGVKPWEGYQCYRGSIPFDGKSLIRRIAKSGICLAFSSAAHQRSGIMSSRLFEGLAAGALVIANRHPFIDKYFKGLVHEIDDSQSSEAVLSQIVDVVEDARSNPARANEMANAAQELFFREFSLDHCLRDLAAAHSARVAGRRPTPGTVDAFVSFTSTRLPRLAAMIRMLERQDHPLNSVVLILDETWYTRNRTSIENLLVASKLAVSVVPAQLFEYADDLAATAWRSKAIGRTLHEALGRATGEYFLLVGPEDEIFHDHVSSLVRVLDGSPDTLVASSGVVIESRGPKMKLERRLAFLAPRIDDYLYANQTRYAGSHLYRRAVLSHTHAATFALLDGQEHNLLNCIGFLRGRLAFSHYASLVYLEHEEARQLQSFVPVEQQHQFIRDTVRAEVNHLAFLRATPLPPVVFASPTGTPIPWDVYRQSRDRATRIDLGRRYELVAKSEGLRLLSKGFYGAEADAVWLDGTQGELEFIAEGASAAAGKRVLRLEMEGRNNPKTKERQFVTVTANGFTVGETPVEEQWAEYSFDLGPDVFGGADNLRIRLQLDHASTIEDSEGGIVDGRQLGMRIRSLRLV